MAEGNDRICGNGIGDETIIFIVRGGFRAGSHYLIEVSQGAQLRCRYNLPYSQNGSYIYVSPLCTSPFDPNTELVANFWKSDRNGAKLTPAQSNPYRVRIVPCP